MRASVHASVRACVLWSVKGSQLTRSQKLLHRLLDRLGGYKRGAIEGAHGSTTYYKSTRPLGVRDGSEVALDTHLCSPVVSERERRLAMVASWSQATVFSASCVRKSRERSGKKANEFLPLAD